MNPTKTVLIERPVVSEKRLTMPWEVCPMGGSVMVVTTYRDGTREVRTEPARPEDYQWD